MHLCQRLLPLRVKVVSAVPGLMNGAVICHAPRRQSTVNHTSTEAEVKAAALVAEALAAIVQLWSEIAGAVNLLMRVLIDSKAAKHRCSNGTSP